ELRTPDDLFLKLALRIESNREKIQSLLKRPTFEELIEPPNSSWVRSIRDDALNDCTCYGCQQTDDLPTWARHGSSIRKARGHTLQKICLQYTIELNNN
ncbi:hypothetical protein NC651_027537, partial [Populus alba x Populus x berolinensis]